MDTKHAAHEPDDPLLMTDFKARDVETATAAAEQGKEALKDIAFGSLAGVAGKYVEYPFDTVKVRLQSQPDHLPLRYTGPLDCFRQSIRQHGFLGIYRGISAPLIGAALETSSLFFSVSGLMQALFALRSSDKNDSTESYKVWSSRPSTLTIKNCHWQS